MTSRVAARLARIEAKAGQGLGSLVVVERTNLDEAKAFLNSDGVDLGRITFVTGVTDGRDNPEEWLRMARENLIYGNVRVAPAAVIW
jgi:hypothetical protein